MNFFSEFLLKKAKRRQNSLFGIVGVSAFFGILILVYAYFSIIVKGGVDRELKNIEDQLADPKYAAAKVEVARLNREIDALNNYLSALSEVDRRISAFHKLSAEENYIIVNAFPEDTYMARFEITENVLKLNGFTAYIELVPAITQNLQDTGLFSVIYPPLTKWVEIEEKDLEDPQTLGDITVEDITANGLRGYYEFEISGTFAIREGE